MTDHIQQHVKVLPVQHLTISLPQIYEKTD